MMPSLRLVGDTVLIEKLHNPAWVHGPARRFLDRWGIETASAARANIGSGPGGWLDSGQTRASITNETDESAFPKYARVGSNLNKARWGEYGTGLLSEDPDSKHERYFPPPAALEDWALRHGFMSGGEVAFLIWKKGGTEPRRFLRDAAKESAGKIDGYLGIMAKEIEAEASA